MEIASSSGLVFEIEDKKQEIEQNYFKVKFIGIGGCGCNITQRMYSLGMRDNLYAINTDALQLRSINGDINRLLIGKNVTKGLGAGGDPVLGQRAMAESLESIIKHLVVSDLTVITIGLGGGTGTGGVIPLAKKLKELGSDVIVIATLPFKFERIKRERAKNALSEIKEVVDAVILFDNESLISRAGSLNMTNAFMVIDEKIAQLLRSLNASFNNAGLINIDYSDMKNVLQKAKGYATFSITTINKTEDLIKLEDLVKVDMVLGSKESAKAFIFNLEGPTKMPLGDAIHILNAASKGISKNAEVAIGVSLYDCSFYAKLFSIYLGVDIDEKSL